MQRPARPRSNDRSSTKKGDRVPASTSIFDGKTLYAGTWNVPIGTRIEDSVQKRMGHLASHRPRPSSSISQIFRVHRRTVHRRKAAAEGKTPGIGAHVGDINVGRSGNTRFQERAADQPTAYVEGRLDDFRILNRALSAAEVLALAKARDKEKYVMCRWPSQLGRDKRAVG